MKEKSFGLRAGALLVFLLSAVVLLGYVQQREVTVQPPAIALKTSTERRATLNAFKAAWESRPSDPTPTNAHAEKDFINRTAAFVDRCSRQEIEREAFSFYRKTVTEFFARYGSEDILDQR